MGTSWLTTVKKVFRSPSKTSPKKSCKRRDERRPEDDDEQKKTEKRRWIFKKTTSNNQEYEAHMSSNNDKKRDSNSIHEKRPVIASMEVNKTVAKIAVRVKEMVPAYLAREYYAALIIQTAFRGYLARRALSALKGIVTLQALVRGHNIRKQAKTTLKCMQTLIRVQAKLRDQSLLRPSHGQTRKSMYAESNNLWDKYKDIHHRKPMFEDEHYIEDQCKAYSYAIEDIEALLQTKKEASLNSEQALAYALSQQIRRLDQKICSKEENHESEWLGQWLESEEYCEKDNRVVTNRIETIKDVDIDSLQFNLRTPLNLRQSHQHQDPPNRRHSLHAQPMTPTLCEVRSIQAQSASPRCVKGYRSHSAATTPSLRHRPTSLTTTTPNYMAATESAKAKARTQSTPRQRHSTSSDRSERGISSVKKRLSFPVPNEAHQCQRNLYDDYSCYSQNLRSPSFRSVQEGLYCLERGTTCSSYTDITGGEASPASTTRLRRWLSL